MTIDLRTPQGWEDRVFSGVAQEDYARPVNRDRECLRRAGSSAGIIGSLNSKLRRHGVERRVVVERGLLQEPAFPGSRGGVGTQPLKFRKSAADLVVHTDTPPLSLVNKVTRTVAEIDPTVPVYRLSTLEQRLDEFQTNRRFQVGVLSLFASVAILLASIGLYGVIRYDVTQRTRESREILPSIRGIFLQEW